jgi:hypothetical protein
MSTLSGPPNRAEAVRLINAFATSVFMPSKGRGLRSSGVAAMLARIGFCTACRRAMMSNRAWLCTGIAQSAASTSRCSANMLL